jgi:putative endonuclease
MPTVYILRCADGTLYTGSTNNVEKRLHEHNTSKAGAKYTRGRRPVELVYQETVASISQARKREAEIKRLSRAEKMHLVFIERKQLARQIN